MLWILAMAQAAAIAVSISIDALAASFAYGCKRIKIPLVSLLIIAITCTAVIGAAFLFGMVAVNHIPEGVAVALSFTILLVIGLVKLFDSITKSIIRKYTQIHKELKLSIFNFKLVLRLYADPEVADVDVSKSISPKEAIVLAVSLSLDGFAVGLGAALMGINGFWLIGFTLVAGFLSLVFGCWLGNKLANTLRFNISWLAGVILIGLAFLQL